ncbi:MAG TPA: Asp-tRNA(Asn)/Glu-tRNA(Gln) amidotransferase subunit GatA [Microthrixaceae bacterium]|nr:Asp-tRNA(Asn)/Glu-tRNA(Gln) amidotransferase subunit GatA [Microthrixaceae bacterium]MCB9401389.1 Asp-tRNA(Asn)/Glu-tRNA(Gln) amidotransferase subunit GatA [Microthrixaceae bacterium]MCO5305946.1 Asp-tRNA(Asn)/Glu-tRNA(Gln) amidotransferase subunit GatA [Microthrixaceae bacterium]HPG13279.1 Asp-tRNA(Asn)/Glu-tRNA(Gln) amidotransferase subunit GatA [Microthrixaceae bacterium]
MRTAVDIAAGVRAGELSALEVLDEHLERVVLREAEIHAFNHLTEEAARAAATGLDRRVAAGEDPGPLAGVPVALKDNLCTEGVPTTCSSRILEGWIPPYTATVVERLVAAGAVPVGKTNLDEFAMGSSTENSAFGPTRNPHDVTRVPGGSSGGSAAAVAAGFAPVSLGSDTGGSIRQPAALCGVVGVKPTYGTVSRLGLVAFGSSLDQIGPFSATVADAALVLEVIGGHDPGDSTSLPGSFPSVSEHLDDGVSGLRVGIVTEMMGDGIAADVTARVRAAADALAAAGATVEEVSVRAVTYGLSAYYLVAPAEASSNLARYDGVRYGVRVEAATAGEMMEATRTAGFGDEVKRRIMLGTYALSAGYYDAFYGKALKVRTLIRRDFDAAYERFDVLLSPTSPTTAFPFGDKTADPMAMYLNDVCTIPTNLAGHPAMSVPFGVGDDGLPVGVQVLAPALGEVVMFRTAAVLEGSVR